MGTDRYRHLLDIRLAGLLLLSSGCGAEPELSTWSLLDQAPEAVCGPAVLPRAGLSARVEVRLARDLCDIVAVPVVTLHPALDGSRPDPGTQALNIRDGRYITTAAHSVEVLEWAADGEFMRSIGTPGEGPGEFSPRGALQLFAGAQDSLYVLDGAHRWSVFDSELEFRRAFAGRHTGRNRGTVQVVPGSGILTTAELPGVSTTAAFRISDFDGGSATMFGPAPAPRQAPDAVQERLSAMAGRDRFWVVPPNGAASHLRLEQWTIDGALAGTLDFRPAWLPADGYPALGDPTEPRLPEYDMIHVDDRGLIWVVVAVRDERWRHVPGPEKRELQQELYDARLVVIDPAEGAVIASHLYDGPDDELPPFARFFPGTRRSYRVVRDSVGLQSIEIFDIYLVPRAGRAGNR